MTKDLIQDIEFDQGKRRFTVVLRERAPGSNVFADWHEHSSTVALTFRITDVTVRAGGNEIFACGIRDDGEGVIEQFNFQPRPNGLEAVGMPTVVLPRGTPMLNHSTEQVVNGGTWSAPTSSRYGVPTRVQVLGDTIGVPRSIAVDPSGRYLIIISDTTSDVHLLDLLAVPMTLEVLATPSGFPALADIDNAYILTLLAGGHVVMLHDSFAAELNELDPRIAMIDSENDGVFESITYLGEGESSLDANSLGHHETGEIWLEAGVAVWYSAPQADPKRGPPGRTGTAALPGHTPVPTAAGIVTVLRPPC